MNSPHLPLLFLLMLLLGACKEEDPNSPGPDNLAFGTMQATVAGRLFNGQRALSTQDEDTGIPFFLLSGVYTIDDDNFETILIGVATESEALPDNGTYRYRPECADTEAVGCLIVLYETEDEYWELDYLHPDNAAEVRLEFYEHETGPAVRGTFSCVIINSDTDEPLKISNGRFDVPVIIL